MSIEIPTNIHSYKMYTKYLYKMFKHFGKDPPPYIYCFSIKIYTVTVTKGTNFVKR